MPFKPGHDPNRQPGRRTGSRNLLTLQRAMTPVRPAAEIANRFMGTAVEFLSCIMVDPEWPIDLRMAAAGMLVRVPEQREAARKVLLVHVDTGLKRSHDDPGPEDDVAPTPSAQPGPVLDDFPPRGPFSPRPASLPPPTAPERPRPPARDPEAETRKAAETARLNNQASIERAVGD